MAADDAMQRVTLTVEQLEVALEQAKGPLAQDVVRLTVPSDYAGKVSEWLDIEVYQQDGTWDKCENVQPNGWPYKRHRRE